MSGATQLSRGEVDRARKAKTAARIGTVRQRHYFKLLGQSGRQRPFCSWCALPVSAPLPCVEVSQADRQRRIEAQFGTRGQQQVAARKAAHKARRAIEVVEELARHEAKRSASLSSAVVDQ